MNISSSWLLVSLLNISLVFGANILVFMPLPFNSHIRAYKPLVKELALKGHNVTFYTGLSLDEKIPNLKEIVVENFLGAYIQERLKNDLNGMNGWRHINFVWNMGLYGCETLFAYPEIQELIQSKDQSYDVILLETFFSHEPFAALGHKFNAPIINLHPFRAEEWISDVLRNPQPLSYVPNFRMPFTEEMSFFERIPNVALSLMQSVTGHLYYLPKQEELMRKYFKYPGSETLPPLLTQLKNTAFTFLDGSHIVSFPSPNIPNLISVGGIHITPNKKLPSDLEKWMNESTAGVIYLSMGSLVKTSNMEPENLNVFLKVLGSLPQRILWKWEKDGKIPGQPPNVRTSKWFPQLDILNHPNCKVFITHGGFHSVFEAAYFGVPIIGTPVFVDQESNLIIAEKKGFGQLIKFTNFTVDILSSVLNKVLNDPSYKENAEELSKVLKDVPLTPLETAVYWVEYVIRHKGAKYLQNAGTFLPWYKYYSIDIIAAAILVVIIPIIVLIKLLKLSLQLLLRIVSRKEKIKKMKKKVT